MLTLLTSRPLGCADDRKSVHRSVPGRAGSPVAGRRDRSGRAARPRAGGDRGGSAGTERVRHRRCAARPGGGRRAPRRAGPRGRPRALGRDTGGSVRIPAGLWGVGGFRPSFGRVDTAGVFPLSWSLDTVGPLAGSVADARIGWSALTGVPAAARAVAGLRVGVPAGGWVDRGGAEGGAAGGGPGPRGARP